MADDVKIEHNVDEQGRRVETRVYEVVVDGKKQRVVETLVEQVPMVISERVVEEIAPVVTTRKKETYKDGKVVDTVVEALDNGSVKMNTAPKVEQNVALTRDDLVSVLREVLNTRDNVPVVEEVKPVKPVAKKVALNSKVWDLIEIGAYVVMSGELAFCLYELVLKNWL